MPMKVVAGLDIPKDYFADSDLRRKPAPKSESNVGIVVLYPSMKGAGKGYDLSGGRIDAVLHAGREVFSRKGTHMLLTAEGMKRSPRLDVDGLCAYVDEQHPGRAGQEYYSSCEPEEQTFFVACFPPFNNRRTCNDTTFLEGEIGAELICQYPILKEHRAMLAAMRKLVASFVRPTTDR